MTFNKLMLLTYIKIFFGCLISFIIAAHQQLKENEFSATYALTRYLLCYIFHSFLQDPPLAKFESKIVPPFFCSPPLNF